MKKLIVLIFFINLFAQFLFPAGRLISVECKDISLILREEVDKKISIVYFGTKFKGEKELLYKQYQRTPDNNERNTPSLFPAYGGRLYIEPILKVSFSNGVQTCDMVIDSISYTISTDKNVKTITLVLADKVYPIKANVIFDAYWNENVITQRIEIRNLSSGSILLERFYSSYLPVLASEYYLTHFNGTWANEMQIDEVKLTPGTRVIESKKGVRTTQSENPSFLLAIDKQMQPYNGDVIIGALAWSGNYKINFELDEFNVLHILPGINPYASMFHLDSQDSFLTPKMIWTFSSSGYSQASRNLHDWSRKYALQGGDRLGNIVLNSWEGAYFDFDEQVIKKMIDNAVEMGVETFVLDDGWFGNVYPRNSDRQGLGDWQVNIKKLPKGINELANYAVSKGLRFGIWIEPEMVSPLSDLARQKPEWVVKSPGREITTLRNQWILDLSNPEVQEFVFNIFKNTIALSPHISYVKWDANRYVESFGSSFLPQNRQSHFWIAYVKGLYTVYERIVKTYPQVEIQLCASGGGRLDYGALQYHNEFWASDNTDPFSRIFIQYATNLIYPPKATASHISISPNHQTGNISNIKLRVDVAMMGRLGVELQPQNLTDNELNFLKKSIAKYKKLRHIVHLGDWYPVKSPYSPDKFTATQYVTKDKSESLLFAFSLDFHGRTWMPNFILQGLDPNKRYKVTEINVLEKTCFWGNEMSFTGDYLMKVGVNLNLLLRGESCVIHLKAI